MSRTVCAKNGRLSRSFCCVTVGSGATTRERLFAARDFEFIIEPHRGFHEQCCERRSIGLLCPELLDGQALRGGELFVVFLDLLRQALGLVEELLA